MAYAMRNHNYIFAVRLPDGSYYHQRVEDQPSAERAREILEEAIKAVDGVDVVALQVVEMHFLPVPTSPPPFPGASPADPPAPPAPGPPTRS
jgi:hypothetical protein